MTDLEQKRATTDELRRMIRGLRGEIEELSQRIRNTYSAVTDIEDLYLFIFTCLHLTLKDRSNANGEEVTPEQIMQSPTRTVSSEELNTSIAFLEDCIDFYERDH